MSKGHNKQGSRRKRGEWETIARGRAHVQRVPALRIGCPHNASHRVGSLGAFLNHLNVCRG